jgi:hypothetical protein
MIIGGLVALPLSRQINNLLSWQNILILLYF